ncbi:uncharacterized protein TNCT_216301 [Trichonephila clavata]|uniref:Uncharacterized protein n=1 Tax=Trichonephila clavata TaxID=2740835 RepID=A0A8X6F1N1_TRICU|nr:uncharacterized protein TNCT_216301 [Trichonephila clavata]
MCYSSNLHLDDEAEPEKWDINSSPREVRNMIDYFTLQMPNNEDFLFESFPKLVFSVHSPFVRDNPHILQNELKFGHSYEINVHLKEEHLLQHPYPTDCADYDDLWRKNNKTGPRSQEVCKKKCSDAYAQQCWKCIPFWKHLKYNETCVQDYSFCEKMYHEDIPSCEMKCKVNCLKLKYYFTVKDKPDQFESQTVSESSDLVHVFLFMDNTEVEVMKHNRLYGTEELFSYIGGLMGCWLGISVWASVGIFEKIYWKIVQVQQQLRKK